MRGIEIDGAKLALARNAARLSVTELAQRAGIGAPYLRRLESGRQRHPTLKVIKGLEDALAVPASTFGADIPDRTPQPVSNSLTGDQHAETP